MQLLGQLQQIRGLILPVDAPRGEVAAFQHHLRAAAKRLPSVLLVVATVENEENAALVELPGHLLDGAEDVAWVRAPHLDLVRAHLAHHAAP